MGNKHCFKYFEKISLFPILSLSACPSIYPSVNRTRTLAHACILSGNTKRSFCCNTVYIDFVFSGIHWQIETSACDKHKTCLRCGQLGGVGFFARNCGANKTASCVEKHAERKTY